VISLGSRQPPAVQSRLAVLGDSPFTPRIERDSRILRDRLARQLDACRVITAKHGVASLTPWLCPTGANDTGLSSWSFACSVNCRAAR
jgi:hypothetical protein